MSRKAASLSFVLALSMALAVGAQAGQAITVLSRSFARIFLTSLDDFTWPSSQTVVDANGGVHATYYDTQSVYYAYCAADCGNPANWGRTAVGDTETFDGLNLPALAVDAGGYPRLMRYDDSVYVYAECEAGCTQAGNWTSVTVPLADQGYVMFPDNARYFALDTQGRPRFVAEFYEGGFVYATCDGNCTTAANWHDALIDFGPDVYFDGPQLALNGSGQPRVVAINDDEQLLYAQCDANCAQAANWTRVTLYDGVGEFLDEYPNYSLRLDAAGRPRIAFYLADASDTNLYYAWSNAEFTSAASWSNYGLVLPSADKRTLDLALDGEGRPRVAFATREGDLDLAECTANCESAAAAWQVEHVETNDELNASDPLPPDPGCQVSSWLVGNYPSLALDGAGNPTVSYYARNVQSCNGHASNNARTIRLATAGTTPQPHYDWRLYLPLAVR
ncbi:MAG: hypothetical protein GX597_26395 [Anaerolineaceae bacterium]|nr:hypothetical protein [Anaerolineaceae bacterium]